MKKILCTTILALSLSSGLSACNNLTPQQRNTALGVAAGGVAGNLLGNGRTSTTLGGAALGGVIGSQIY